MLHNAGTSVEEKRHLQKLLQKNIMKICVYMSKIILRYHIPNLDMNSRTAAALRVVSDKYLTGTENDGRNFVLSPGRPKSGSSCCSPVFWFLKLFHSVL